MGAATVITVREERIAAVEALSAERTAVMHGVAEERIAVITALHDERLAILASADAIAARSIERSERAAVRLMWLGAAIISLPQHRRLDARAVRAAVVAGGGGTAAAVS